MNDNSTEPEKRLAVIESPSPGVGDGLDIKLGLLTRPLTLPSKYFYDDRGSALFEAICEQPEYYVTRTERALLDEVSASIAEMTRARELVELGAGTAHKTHYLIAALLEQEGRLHYAPLDISEYALTKAVESLSAAFPDLYVTGIQCDYTQTLEALDPDPGCLAVFLGSTIGNFSHDMGVEFLKRIWNRLAQGDWLLLGLDLVKPVSVQEAAYNDAAGVTANFNKNILNVVNREVEGNFNPEDFRHRAFFNVEKSQVEMHLVAIRDVNVRLEALGLDLEVAAGESIRTEVSRKFTRESATTLLTDSGFDLEHWFESTNGYFGLALASFAGK